LPARKRNISMPPTVRQFEYNGLLRWNRQTDRQTEGRTDRHQSDALRFRRAA